MKKSKFSQTECKYLGYLISRDGFKPLENKVEAMLKIAPPEKQKATPKFFRFSQLLQRFVAKKSSYFKTS